METTDILICGCGPTGAMLCAYLGQQSVKNIVIERELEITQDPRGIALDEDGIRFLQGLGLYDKIFTEIGKKVGYFNFVSGANNLHKTPFLRFNCATINGGTSHPGFMSHKQPVLERCIRDVISQQPSSEIRSGSTVTSISEDDEYVYATYTNIEGEERKIRARFFVGADGKTGFTRKRYLEPRGITMEKDEKFKYEASWVALNWKITPPTPNTHPDFPLWKLGYTPDQVYAAFFPPQFTFICNPERPAVCGRFGLRTDQLWRFEFVVKKDEDGYEMAKYENVRKVVFPYLTHPKGRYGLEQDIIFPESCIEVIRSRPFTFSARSCNEWALGRVILCGDVAHVFPPFGGQGIASGFRDAISLSWRLALAIRSTSSKTPCLSTTGNFTTSPQLHTPLFHAWSSERKQQLERSLAATIVNGNFCNERSLLRIFFRDWSLWAIQLVPAWRKRLEMGQRKDGLTRYEWSEGMPFLPKRGGGVVFPQVFCRGVGSEVGRAVFTDDVVFERGKKGLFQLVVLLGVLSELDSAVEELSSLSNTSEPRIDEATFLIEAKGASRNSKACKIKNAHWIIHADEKDSDLWQGLPEPIGYDGKRMRREVKGRYVIVRPDRFILAACGSVAELRESVTALGRMFKGL